MSIDKNADKITHVQVQNKLLLKALIMTPN